MQYDPRGGRAAPHRQASGAYLMSWVAVAAFGLGYIGVAATRPDLLGSILPLADPSHESPLSARSAADVSDELATLRKWVHDLQHELAATKSALQDQVTQTGSIVQRLSAAEERLPQVREIKTEPAGKAAVQRLQNRAQVPAPPPGEPSARPAQAAAAAASAPDAPAAVDNLKVLNSTATAPIATGSLPDAPAIAKQGAPAFGPAKVTAAPAAGGVRGIEIASADTLEGLRAKWGELSGRNAETLGALAPRYRLASDGRAAPFTLLAGPFETPAEAARTCNALKARGVACRVGAYIGNAF